MADQNFPDNIIYELDNLDVLRGMNSETVDLIATDPPFNTRRNRSGAAGFYVDNWKWGDTGKLPDQWAWNEVHPVWLDEIKDENRALYEVIEATEYCHGQDIAAFLCFLSVRLLEMHRVLKPTGSIYLHCDHTANAYIRMAMDAIFGAKNFRNEIVWCYTGPSNTPRWFPRKHDTIWFYAKSKETKFHGDNVRRPFKVPYAPARGIYEAKIWEDTEKKRQIHERGTIPTDWWADGFLSNISGYKSELTGSPDQKPLALYERIVLASSNKGDLVLDPFAGYATTLIAARDHGRRWVGIERRPDARHHVVCRMLGLKAQEAEKARENTLYSDWITARLAELESHYRTEPPVRTDEGNTAPFLAPVFTPKEKLILTHRQMKDYLVEAFGLQCWGCNFKAPDERYLQLDHADPKRNGGSNDLDNRVLLCQPCNLAKSDRITLIQLRRENAQNSYPTKPAGTKRGQDGHPIDLPRARQKCREALERHRIGQPMQIGMML